MNLTQMLRRIDEELTSHRQQIAVSRVKIAELEETRRTLMGLAEADQAHAEATKGSSATLLNGSHGKPVLIVRKVGSGDEPVVVEDKGLGIVTSGKRKGQPRLRPARSGVKLKGIKVKKRAAELRERILKVVEPGEDPISPKDIGNNIGLSPKEEDRKPLWNVLYNMRVKGEVQRDPEGRYFRPVQQ